MEILGDTILELINDSRELEHSFTGRDLEDPAVRISVCTKPIARLMIAKKIFRELCEPLVDELDTLHHGVLCQLAQDKQNLVESYKQYRKALVKVRRGILSSEADWQGYQSFVFRKGRSLQLYELLLFYKRLYRLHYSLGSHNEVIYNPFIASAQHMVNEREPKATTTWMAPMLHANLPLEWQYEERSVAFLTSRLRFVQKVMAGKHLRPLSSIPVIVKALSEHDYDPPKLLEALFRDTDPEELRGVQYYNPFRSRMRHMLHWRHAGDTHRDAGLVFKAASEGRPMELAYRLRLGRRAGGHEAVDGDGWNALTAACAGGHGECVLALAHGVRDADWYLKRRDGGGRGCWEVAVGDARGALESIRADPLMLCEDLPDLH